MARGLPIREPRPSALARKTRIASCTFPYARGLETNTRSLCHAESLDTDARSLRRAESIDTDVKLLRHGESLETSIRELCCMPVIPRPSLGEVLSSSTMEQSLEREAVSEGNQQNVPKCAPDARAALMLPKPPVFSIPATSLR